MIMHYEQRAHILPHSDMSPSSLFLTGNAQVLSVDMHSSSKRRSLLEFDVIVTTTVSGIPKEVLENSLNRADNPFSNAGTLSARDLSGINGAVSMYAQQLLLSALVAVGVMLMSWA